jgi:GT2 family glycosyltransferase
MFYDDIDICWRAQLLGYKIAAAKDAIVYHKVAGSLPGTRITEKEFFSTVFRRYHGLRSQTRVILKNHCLFNLIWVFPLFLFSVFIESILLFLTFRWKVILAYIKALAWNFINLENTLKERRKVQKLRKVPCKEILKRMYKGSARIKTFLLYKKIPVYT